MCDPAERGGEVVAEVVLGVVGQHGLDGDPVRLEELMRSIPEPSACDAAFVGMDLTER